MLKYRQLWVVAKVQQQCFISAKRTRSKILFPLCGRQFLASLAKTGPKHTMCQGPDWSLCHNPYSGNVRLHNITLLVGRIKCWEFSHNTEWTYTACKCGWTYWMCRGVLVFLVLACISCSTDITPTSSDRRSLQGANASVISVWREEDTSKFIQVTDLYL